jgi:hypothetical protein
MQLRGVSHPPARSFSTAVMFSAGVLAFSVTDCSDWRKPCRNKRWEFMASASLLRNNQLFHADDVDCDPQQAHRHQKDTTLSLTDMTMSLTVCSCTSGKN